MSRVEHQIDRGTVGSTALSGEFLDFGGERYYVIRHSDRMPPFFISVISSSDHWLFLSSTGGLTAGRVSPETALFPYVTVDKVHESTLHTGSKTIFRVKGDRDWENWEPFNREQDGRYTLSRNLYKNALGNKLCFEEINHDLQLAFRYGWATSDDFGFVRRCELENLSLKNLTIELIDGLQNILPAGTPSVTQANSSNLVDAYKWTELFDDTGLAIYALYSGISDRAEPCESLRANAVFSLGFDDRSVLLSSAQVDDFRRGEPVEQESRKRGVRGAYLVNTVLHLSGGGLQAWSVVADVERSQKQVVELLRQLGDLAATGAALQGSVDQGSDDLARIVAAGDGCQVAAEETVTVHHHANVLFNILRGGLFNKQYTVSASHLCRYVRHFNRDVYARNKTWLENLPEELIIDRLLSSVSDRGDLQLERLCHEYLPLSFGRRHGDPSRPWNKFTIRLRDENGDRLLAYEGNWRDIFQNWEALAFSFPEYVESMVAKFVNASTLDGHNPYRISSDGIDWEVEEPDNPWSYIGYWGDHQIIYLLKLLELSRRFHPARLRDWLRRPIFSYANVPYRIRQFEALLENPKSTVSYDHDLADQVALRVSEVGADGALVPDAHGDVYCVNLAEKLLVPLLSKLGNLVVDGGIWLNTQRPEWNDANNALVGHGLSVVTLCYLRRYVEFLRELLSDESEPIDLSAPVSRWLSDTAAALASLGPLLGIGPLGAGSRFRALEELGLAASRYRESVYGEHPFTTKVPRPVEEVRAMLDAAQAAIDHSIGMNRREDGLYHAYNLLNLRPREASIDELYLMLEGQVAVLSSGAVPPAEAVSLLEALFDSDIYRADQASFMLYPDRQLPGFLEKNRIPPARIERIPTLGKMLDEGDEAVVCRDADGCYRFNADFRNVADLDARLAALVADYGDQLEADRTAILDLYEEVFHHRAFTGRSGTMFGFEGLGCIYWHMVSKLLLAVQENFFAALDQGVDGAVCRRLGSLYYQVRGGLGFNKSPAEYGAFPTDPYSHTPAHSGAQQPGMTGQVKEEVLTRFGELGLRLAEGQLRFDPRLLREREFLTAARQFRFLDVDGNWQDLQVPARGLAFTWCQVPILYRLTGDQSPTLTVTRADGVTERLPNLSLPAELSTELFRRSGRVRKIEVSFAASMLLEE